MVVVHGIVIQEVPDPQAQGLKINLTSKLNYVKIHEEDKNEIFTNNEGVVKSDLTSLNPRHEVKLTGNDVQGSPQVTAKVVADDSKDDTQSIPHRHSLDHLIQGWEMGSILPDKYNKLIPPTPKKGEPVRVQITLNITQILAVKEDEQVCSGNAIEKACVL